MDEDRRTRYSIIADGALQFIDYNIDLSLLSGRKPLAKKRVPFYLSKNQGGRNVLTVLEEDEDNPGRYHRPAERETAFPMHYEIEIQEAFNCCLNHWLPIPFLVRNGIWPDRKLRYGYGPTDWVRGYLSRLGDEDSLKYRLTLVFDPQVEDGSANIVTDGGVTIYHALSEEDVTKNVTFGLASAQRDNAWFYNELPWVQEAVRHCRESYRHKGRPRRVAQAADDMPPAFYEDQDSQVAIGCDDIGVYNTMLIGLELSRAMGEVRVVNPAKATSFIDVDLVLDIGNSRMTGVLVETKPQRDTKLTDCYILPIRDLSEPAKVYAEPIDTRVEFAEPFFGQVEWSMKSRLHNNSFRWPSTVRLGPEAGRLAQAAREDKGPTGMSSPKRYLWDTRQRDMLWYLNNKYEHHGGIEERAAGRGAFLMEVNVAGMPLSVMSEDQEERRRLRDILGEMPAEITGGYSSEDDFPALESRYSHSSIMMFLLSEVVAQAISSINSPMIREGRGHPDTPRRLSRIILTVPTAMPLIEQRIFRTWARLAVTTVWSAMGWKKFYQGPRSRNEARIKDFRSSPQVHCDWDEATCTQVVWLYNEICERFHNNALELFRLMGRERPRPGQKQPEGEGGQRKVPSLRIASIDMGGGTTDLSVTTYVLHNADYAAPLIKPHLDFRDGFNVAGDDIMHKIIVSQFLDKIGRAAAEAGVPEARSRVRSLFLETPQMNSKPDEVKRLEQLRAQFVDQVAVPVALAILKRYEKADLTGDELNFTLRLDQVLNCPEGRPEGRLDRILNYMEEELRRSGWASFDLCRQVLEIDLREVDRDVASVSEKIMSDLGEVVKAYDCDLLILTGRPSRWPAVKEAPYRRLCLPPDRIVPMHQYRVSAHYPFVAHGRIEDPKTTVVVGGIICALAEGSLEGITIDTSSFEPQPTTRFLGLLSGRGQMEREHVWFPEIDVFSEKPLTLDRIVEFSSPVPLGFRQLDLTRWTTTRLYSLEFASGERLEEAKGRKPYQVALQYILEPFEDPYDEKLQEELAADRQRSGSKRRRTEGRLEVGQVLDRFGEEVKGKPLRVRLQTLRHDEGYWLDTGVLDVQ